MNLDAGLRFCDSQTVSRRFPYCLKESQNRSPDAGFMGLNGTGNRSKPDTRARDLSHSTCNLSRSTRDLSRSTRDLSRFTRESRPLHFKSFLTNRRRNLRGHAVNPLKLSLRFRRELARGTSAFLKMPRANQLENHKGEGAESQVAALVQVAAVPPLQAQIRWF